MRSWPRMTPASPVTTTAPTSRNCPGPCECRKPGPLLYRRAAADLGLDLARSWWVGDRVRDIAAATGFGGRGVLVLTGNGAGEAEAAAAQGWLVATDLAAAAQLILPPGA
jgi:Histidinol phosphatase and related phosphatases